MKLNGNTVKLGSTDDMDDTEKKSHNKFVGRMLGMLMLFAMYINPASALNSTELTENMDSIAAVIIAMGSIWDALLGMIVALMPLIIVLSILTFITGLIAVILSKVKGGASK